MRTNHCLVAFSFAVGVALVPGLAFSAGKKDKEAEALVSRAIDEDYLGTEYDKALAKLKEAVDLCGADNCSPEVLGKVYVARATIVGVGQKNVAGAKDELVLALKADPQAKLIDGLSTPELEKALADAKGAGSTPTDGGGNGGATPPKPQPAADFQHVPVSQQAVNFPVPVFAEIPEEVGATKVIARYKPFGGSKWETLNLAKVEGGFGGEIPCDAVSTTGDLRYYIIASDDSGTPVATAGSMKDSFKVPLKNKIQGDRPSLPGKEPPQKCKLKENCPPGMPGCGGPNEGKPEGALCDASPECGVGKSCQGGVCTIGEETSGPEEPGTHHVVSVGAQFDIAYVGDASDVCNASSGANYICMHQDSNEQFLGNPVAKDGTNGISGGLAFGGARLLAGYDYFFKFGLGLGARVGFAFGGPNIDTVAPPTGSDYGAVGKSFFPAHIEGRVSWKFLNPNPVGGDFAPHAFIGGGGAQVNTALGVTVCDGLEEGDPNDCPGGAKKTRVDAYQLSGLTFVSFGGGATYMFVDNFGVSADLKFMVLFPTVGFTISPTISPVIAF